MRHSLAKARRWCALSALGVSVLAAGAAPGRPSLADRVTKRFGFEERETNPTDLPAHWIRAQHDPPTRIRPRFPIWNQAHLDYENAHSGEGSVRLPTRGGSVSLLLDPGVIPVFPDADYVVTAFVRTRGVDHARARLAVRLLDSDGRRVPGTEVASPPMETGGYWSPVSVHVRGDHPEAVSMQLELLLEQPGPVGELPFEDLEIIPEDFSGAAWFDDIAVVQVPRMEAWTRWPGNLVPSGATPEIDLFMRDLAGQPLEVRLVTLDLGGQEVDSETVRFEGGRLERSWTPNLDRHGWYRVRVTASHGGKRVGTAYTDFIWRSPGTNEPAESTPGEPYSDFGLSISGVPGEGLSELGELALASGVGRVMTDLWFDGEPSEESRREGLADLANRISPLNRELALAIPALPAEVSEIRGLDAVMEAIADESSDGATWLDPRLMDLGHRIRWWRAGGLDESRSLAGPEFPGAALERLRSLVPGAVLETSWSPLRLLPPEAVAPGLAVAQPVPSALAPAEIGPALRDYVALAGSRAQAGWGGPKHAAVLRCENEQLVGLDAAIDRVLISALHAWATIDEEVHGPHVARGRSLRLDSGWRWVGGRRPQLMPEPISGAWLTLMEMLHTRRAERLARVAPGVEGMLLVPGVGSPDETPAVAAFWRADAAHAPDRLELLLSHDPVRVIDRFGNGRTAEPEKIEPTEVLTHSIDLSGGVVYVEGVDAAMLRFMAGVRVEPGLIETGMKDDMLELVLENPWSSPIRGKYYLVEPGGLSEGNVAARDRSWDIRPRQAPFALAAGESSRIPVSFATSAGVESGARPLVVDLEVESPSGSGLMRVTRRVDVGLEDIELVVRRRVTPSEDVMVLAEVTNTGGAPVVVNLYATAPGFPRQRSAATPVGPGQRVVKAFPFQDARSALAGETISIGLFIRETGGRLTRRVEIGG